MRFSFYMQEWLYGKDGYYSTFKEIGKNGDFYTAVSTSRFFGGSIAERILKTIRDGYLSKDTTILEVGAHQGYLLADIAQFIYTLDANLFKTLRFAIYEPQKDILFEQRKYLSQSFGDHIDIVYYSSLDEIDLDSAFIVANEIFDAFSCDLVKDDKMLYIDNGKFYFSELSDDVRYIKDRYFIKKGEISIGYDKFIKKLLKCIKRFEFVTFDYGEMEHRGEFSLRVYYAHKVYPFFSLTNFVDEKERIKDVDLYNLYKKCDITYDVFFKYIVDLFEENGAKMISYMTQSKALVEFGLVELLEILKDNSSFDIYMKELNKIKMLIDPSFMGERFKCLIFRRD